MRWRLQPVRSLKPPYVRRGRRARCLLTARRPRASPSSLRFKARQLELARVGAYGGGCRMGIDRQKVIDALTRRVSYRAGSTRLYAIGTTDNRHLRYSRGARDNNSDDSGVARGVNSALAITGMRVTLICGDVEELWRLTASDGQVRPDSGLEARFPQGGSALACSATHDSLWAILTRRQVLHRRVRRHHCVRSARFKGQTREALREFVLTHATRIGRREDGPSFAFAPSPWAGVHWLQRRSTSARIRPPAPTAAEPHSMRSRMGPGAAQQDDR